MVKKRSKTSTAPKSTGRGSATTNGARTPRKEAYDGRRLSRVVERLREQAAHLANLAQQLQEAELERVEIDGHAMLLRGLNQIDNFADNAARAIREANRVNRAI